MHFIRFFALWLGIATSIVTQAQEIDVPNTLEFAGIKLKIDDDARQLIAKNAWLLTKNEAYFSTTRERFDLYLPVLNRVLAEEGLPEDFKYLVMQESSLVSDVVSRSNAVGYWQFKEASAMEVGMRVDNDVDERKHIIASTRGAAKYIKRNNFYLQNWLSALLSHYAGLGGAKSLAPTDWANATKLDIDKNTHWYILKYLAHKIVFEPVIGRNLQPNLVLLEYNETSGKTLKQIANDLDVDREELETYNKWLGCSRIPDDKPYTVLVPAPASQLTALVAKTGSPYRPLSAGSEALASIHDSPVASTLTNAGAVFPVLKKKREDRLYTINGKAGIQARAGDNPRRLANVADISVEKFLRFNDLKATDRLVPGQVYYLKKKRNHASVEEHVVMEGETLWEISQRYGITMKALLRKNRMDRVEKLKHGRVLWLYRTRPSGTPVEIRDVPRPASVLVAQNKPTSKPAKPVKTPPAELPMEKEDLPVTPVINESPKVATSTKTTPRTTSVIKTDVPKVEREALYAPTRAASVSNDRTDNRGVHTVKQGQTLYAIARQYGISVAELRTWNGLTEADGVKMDQELLIAKPAAKADSTRVVFLPPSPKPPTEEYTEYVVQPGDTVYKISRTYGVDVKDLLAWNGKTDVALSQGEVLKVKKK